MDEILKKLAEHTGISEATARSALATILAFLKDHLPAGISEQLMHTFPDAPALVSAHEAVSPTAGASGGLVGAITGMAAKYLGDHAGEATKLVAKLHEAGLDFKQIEAFIPKVLEMLKAHIPAELYEKILTLIPGLKPAAEVEAELA